MMPIEKSDLLQGTLDMLILKIVALGPVHGYGISLRIRQISQDVLQLQQGSLYPALHRLEKRGWLASDWGTLDFDGQENFKEQVRHVYRIRLLDATLPNLKSAFRFIRKSPTFSLTVILTLTSAIGANSAVFPAIDPILLKPLPFPQADQLVRVDQYDPKNPRPFNLVAPARLEDWNRLNSTFQALTGYYTEDVSESTGPLPDKVTRAWVSPRFFQLLGAV